MEPNIYSSDGSASFSIHFNFSSENAGAEMQLLRATLSRFKVESLRTILIHEKNSRALEMLEELEKTLEANSEKTVSDTVAITLLYLLTGNIDEFNNMGILDIKFMFGSCPFTKVQELTGLGTELRHFLSQDCLKATENYPTLNEWFDLLSRISSIFDLPKPSIPDFFFDEMVRITTESEPLNQPGTSGLSNFSQPGPSGLGNSADEPIDSAWLETQYLLHEENLFGLTYNEFYDSIFQSLSSGKSNDELQNDLFEMLGFDSFTLIEQLLINRNKIVDIPDTVQTKVNTEKQELPKLKSKLKAPAVTIQVTVQSEEEKVLSKQIRKAEKKMDKGKKKYFRQDETTAEVDTLQNDYEVASNVPLLKISAKALTNNLLHVHDLNQNIKLQATICGHSAKIPHDAIKEETKLYEEITIPARPRLDPLEITESVSISSLDNIGRMVFKGLKTFNTIQSEVFPTAYYTNENMLICAPTGAGKTNIALMAVVHEIKNNIENNVVHLEKFKIVYVCPMKALAAEITKNFRIKLACLGITVKELTGDKQLSRKEIMETQILVTTPEKWDVITRKGTADAELTSLLKLLILDEIHILNSDRGPVIEAVVTRTLRQVITSQQMIRIMGLSATVPNYVDVADFLRVNIDQNLFFFDSRYRSVPLTQTFIGLKAIKPAQAAADMDEICFEKCVKFLREGHQVMIFVHARNQTYRTANYLKSTAAKQNLSLLFQPKHGMESKRRLIEQNKNGGSKSYDELLPYGLGVHHAGMMRRDRTATEEQFVAGAIKVLICTATLAWGVNLPAHAVIIKGTRFYEPKKSNFTDIDILDVMQIFGRAGRPQYDTSGHGIIITTNDKFSFYISAMTNQVPIESKFVPTLQDNLNAEVVLGTVANIQEGVEWLTYTYLYRRMRINPLVYGITYETLQCDPNLRETLLKLIHDTAKSLDKARMIRYDMNSGDLMATDLARSASYFYINFDTMQIFLEMIESFMTESDILNMMCFASEFQQIVVRQEELEDLDYLLNDYCLCNVPGGVENSHGKVNILMQTYLSRGYIKSVSLASDMEFINQSATRIARALFDIALHQNKATLSGRCLTVAQMFEQQLWSFQGVMGQFTMLPRTVIQILEDQKVDIFKLRDMTTRQLGEIARNMKIGDMLKKCVDSFPILEVESAVKPITRGVIKVSVTLTPNFQWNDAIHGKSCENFWIWVEDPDTDMIYHNETCSITKAIVLNKETVNLTFTIPLHEPLTSQYIIRVSSDRWMFAVYTHAISLLNLHLPASFTGHTKLLPLTPIATTILHNPYYESLYPFSHFNPIQTQMFHCLYHTDHNVLLGAPTGSGKTIAAELCMLRLFNDKLGLKVVYIAPLKALVRERVEDWKERFGRGLGKKVEEVTGDVTPSTHAMKAADIIITTPEKWDVMSRGWQTRDYIKKVGLMIIDEIHLLGEDRGPVIEVIVSRINFISKLTKRKLRIIGLSTAMANAGDLASWLAVGEVGLYNFQPSVRPVPLEVHISGFPGKHYCPRMEAMNRPAYQAIRQHAPNSPTLIFCSSRKQTRITAVSLITFLTVDVDSRQWLHCDEQSLQMIINNVRDEDLRHFLEFGIGIHHAGLQERDRKTVEELFVNQKIQVLVATATLAWGVNFPAHLVIIKGTEYFDGRIKHYVDMPITDVLQMMGRAGRPQFDTSGVACVFVHDNKKTFYKKFLYEPFPVESNLLQALPDHINAEIAAGTVINETSLKLYLSWTYFYRRLLQNPTFYKLQSAQPDDVDDYLNRLITSIISELVMHGCVHVDEEEDPPHYEATFCGQLASYYYLSYKTMNHFRKNMKKTDNILEILTNMCHAEEYALFPVRHNEDIINRELAKVLKHVFYVNEDFDSPFLKVSLLIQAYLVRLPLPNQEYTVDLKSVLDQAIRILQAMIDIAANSKWLSGCIKTIHLMQMLVQGATLGQSGLLALPHISEMSIKSFVRELKKEFPHSSIDTLVGLQNAYYNYRDRLANAIMSVFNANHTEDILKTISTLPSIELSLKIIGDDDKSSTIFFAKAKKTHTLVANKEYNFEFSLRRFGPSKLNVAMCRFPKRKDESWFVCIGNEDHDELMELKRVVVVRESKVSFNVVAPGTGNHRFFLYLLSDSYIGLDQQYTIPFNVI